MAGRLRAIVTLARCRILAEIGQRADRASHASGVTATELFREGKSPEQPEGQETSCRPGRPQGRPARHYVQHASHLELREARSEAATDAAAVIMRFIY